MKTLKLLLLLGTILIVSGSQASFAQDYGYYVVDLQCDPISCQEGLPPVTQGGVEVNFYGDCDLPDGSLVGLSGSAIIAVGVPKACNAPFAPYASVEITSTLELDDNGDEYQVDYVNNITEVFDAEGDIVEYDDSFIGCDGSSNGNGSGVSYC